MSIFILFFVGLELRLPLRVQDSGQNIWYSYNRPIVNNSIKMG